MERDIKDMVLGLRKSISEIDAQLKSIEKSDSFKENAELAEKNAKLTARNEKLAQEAARLSADNAALKNALYEQYFNEKISTVEKTRRNIEVFFSSEVTNELNRLTSLEASIKQRLSRLTSQLNQTRWDINHEAEGKMQAYQNEITQKIMQAKLDAAQISISEQEKAEFERLKQENLTSEQITALSRKNNFERYIGLNILNTVGIVLFIIGAFTAGQMGYIWISFLLGAGFLVVGEVMNRKRANVFSLGVTAGGVGILYASLALGHFVHSIIGMYPALGICVAITALTFYLSTRYKAQTLLGITLVGGYLPILSILLDGNGQDMLLFGMMAYFVLFNLLALLLAFRNKWTIATFVGLSLNIIGTGYLSAKIGFMHPLSHQIINLLYIGFAMLVYNAIPIISTYMIKAKFRRSDLVLISINTFFGSIVMFANIDASFWQDYISIAAAAYASMYFISSYLITKKFENAKAMTVLFFVAGIVFAYLFVPMQFDIEWLTPAWMLLAVVLAVFGIIREKRMFRVGCYSVGGAALVWFLFVDFANYQFLSTHVYFTMQYASVTAAGLAVLTAFVLKNQLYGTFQKAFKCIVAINLWLFALYMVYRLWDGLLDTFPGSLISIDYLMIALMAVTTLIFGKVYSKIPRLTDAGIKTISLIFSLLGLLIIFALNFFTNPVASEIAAYPANIAAVATGILIVVEVMGIAAIYDLVRRAVIEKLMGIQYLPLIISGYIVLVFTTTLTIDYGLSFASFWISAIYVITALLWTILGFARRYTLLRRFGLALALFSVVKLFVFDLVILTQEFRILSYFIMGAVLVAISFVYQYFSKRLELGVKIKDEDDFKLD